MSRLVFSIAIGIVAVIAVASGPLFAQSSYPKHGFTVGFGAGLPGGDLKVPFKGTPAVTFAYGYRFLRYLQADVGVDLGFGAANVRDYFETIAGPTRIRDYQVFIPLGGRVVLPLARDRFLLSVGGGGSYLHYTESLDQPIQEVQLACPVCNSRSGWGTYGLGGADVFLSEGGGVRLGGTARLYRGHTTGAAIGSVPGIRTQDRWLQVFAHLGFSF